MNTHFHFRLSHLLLPLLAMSFFMSQALIAQTNEGTDTTDVMHNIHFRNLGPAVAGGRATAVVGIPGNPNVYYVGAAGGGVFKTEDGGVTWKPVFEKESTASIGAIAIAPSNPNYIWVGTGEANLRNDISRGKGVFFSPDAGKSWQQMGLSDVGQISRVVIDPVDPNVVFVAAVGHAWGPNSERGVFRTTDGGKTWQRVLFVNDTTGASDIVMAPGNPKVLFAAMWQVVRHPWKLDNGGTGSGIYKSVDGGTTWKKLTEGLPKGPIGRIALAIARTNPDHVYALIEAKEGMLWQSLDLGEHWQEVSDSHTLNVRPFYFSRFVVSPDNENKLYFLSFLLTESTDGGKTTKSIGQGVHVDHHDIWIDPVDPNRIIEGNDGGVYLSVDGGKSWRFLNNLPIEQYYQIATDNDIPYHVGGGLQDNNAWYGTSMTLHGREIGGCDWFTVAGGDGEYVVPAPSDPNIVYAESQDGFLRRVNLKTGLAKYIRPYLYDASDMAPKDLKYRFNWTTPIAVSYTNPDVVYVGANVLFKTTDGGDHWTVISPDLTRNDKSKQEISGGPVEYDISGAENYDTILSIGISPLDSNVIWVGTDDGLVQVTKDGGKSWTNVSGNLHNVPEWGRIYQIEPSPFDPAKCYITVDLHELDNNRPYVFKTDNFGKSWTSISNGLPDTDPAHVIREDPNKKGFLVVGTETGLYYSNDDGNTWNKLRSNFPTVSVYDIKFVKQSHDLVIATHGRGAFILDNITPLEETNNKILDEDFYLFPSLPAYMFHMNPGSEYDDLSSFHTPNPPYGVVIDYYLKNSATETKEQKKEHKTPVEITVKDSTGNLVAQLYGPSNKGFNRFVWNMRYQSPTKLNFGSKEEVAASPYTTNGPMVVPGKYTIVVTFRKNSQSQQVEVKADPKVDIPKSVYETVTKYGLEVRNAVSAMNEMLNRIQSIQEQISTIRKALSIDSAGEHSGKYKQSTKALEELSKSLTTLKDTVYNTQVQPGVGEDDIHYLTHFNQKLQGMMYAFMSPFAGVPTPVEIETKNQLLETLNSYLGQFNKILRSEISSYNSVASQEEAPRIIGGSEIAISN